MAAVTNYRDEISKLLGQHYRGIRSDPEVMNILVALTNRASLADVLELVPAAILDQMPGHLDHYPRNPKDWEKLHIVRGWSGINPASVSAEEYQRRMQELHDDYKNCIRTGVEVLREHFASAAETRGEPCAE